MHELGMITSVMDAVRDAARDAGATKVLSVDLSVGEMTQAIEECLVFAYDALADQEELFQNSKLNLTMVTPKSRCLECGNEFEHDFFHVFCPACNSYATELIAGRDLSIDSIEIETPDDPDDSTTDSDTAKDSKSLTR